MAAEVRHPRCWLEALAITLGVLVLRLPTLLLDRWYDPDEAAIAMQALAINRGGTLYVDMADRKPPLPPLVYEWIFRITNSTDPRPLRLVVGLMLAGAAIVLVRDVRRTHGESTARWAGALYILGAFAFGPVDAGAANYAHFALPVATVAMLFSRRPGLRWALASGLLLGIAVLCRQSWIFAVPAGAFSAWRAQASADVGAIRPAKKWVRAAPSGVSFGVGFAVGVAACGMFVPFSDFWYWNFASNTGFVFASLGLGDVLFKSAATLGVFLACHLAVSAAALWGSPRSVRTDTDLWLWMLTGCAAVAAGFRFYGHYWMQILPPLVLLGAPVIAALGPRLRTAVAATVVICGLITWSLLFTPGAFRDRVEAAPVAEYIRDHTRPDDRVFIWGSFPELSVETDRPAAGRLVHSDFVTGRSGGRDDAEETLSEGSDRALEMMMDDLLGDPPEIVVDTSGVASLGYVDYPMSVIPELDQFIEDRYDVEMRIGGLTVLRLRPPTTAVSGR